MYFGVNVFDPNAGTLFRADGAVRLRPKSAEVLAMLLANAGHDVHKQTLREAVWPNEFPGDDALTRCISELRSALRDDSKQPRYIATAHRRGYRFIEPVTATPQGVAADRADALLVGRDAELDALGDWWHRAHNGELTVGFIAGAAGVGKSALVNTFFHHRLRDDAVLIGRGHCVEQLAGGEAYLPFFDAIAGLCRGADGDSVGDVLRSSGRSWQLQLTGVRDADDIGAVRHGASSSGEMMRELADTLGAVSAITPVVLVCEDIQFADRASIELFDQLARRRLAGRVLVIGTYRPGDAFVRSHPLPDAVAGLRAAQRCRYLGLEPLSPTAVGVYVSHRLAPDTPSESLVGEIHRRTEGNALFMTTLVDHLIEHDLLVDGDGGVRSRGRIDRLTVPAAARESFAHQLGALAVEDRALLELAAVAGAEFDAEAVLVAAGEDWPGLPTADVEGRLATLARDIGLLHETARQERADGTVTVRYRFRHQLHQQLACNLPAPGRRAAARLRLAKWLAGDERAGRVATR